MVSVAGFLVDSAAAEGSNILERMKRFFVFCVLKTGFRRLSFMVSVVAGKYCLWFPSLVFLFYGFRRGKELFMVSVVVCLF